VNSSDHEKPARRFRSATIYDGLIGSTTRSFLYGLGQDDAEIAPRASQSSTPAAR
jgi:hypothetical protein